MLLNGEYVKINGQSFEAAGKIRFVGLIRTLPRLVGTIKLLKFHIYPLGA